VRKVRVLFTPRVDRVRVFLLWLLPSRVLRSTLNQCDRRYVAATPPWSCVIGVGICAVLWEILLAVTWVVVAEEFSLGVFFLSCDKRGARGRAKGEGEGGAGEHGHQAQEEIEG
jgi:hypothetical protein